MRGDIALQARAETARRIVESLLGEGEDFGWPGQAARRCRETLPAILITADRSPHVRDAARLDRISLLNKPLKPASLRALIGQWRAQQTIAAE